MAETEHFEPCRFCGHDGERLQYCLGDVDSIRRGTAQAQIACLNCGTHGPMADTGAEALRLWNMPVAEHQELIKAQRAARLLRVG